MDMQIPTLEDRLTKLEGEIEPLSRITPDNDPIAELQKRVARLEDEFIRRFPSASLL